MQWENLACYWDRLVSTKETVFDLAKPRRDYEFNACQD